MPLPLLVLVGPTAVGKTALSLRLAEVLDAEIVSADSMQVYRGMDIGTAKPTPAERARVPHHLIDVVDPTEDFSVARYERLAHAAIAGIHARGKLPLLTGGTGLYIKAVVDGLPMPPAPPDPAIRARLEAEADRSGTEALHRRLAQVDPVSAARLHPRDRRRIIRALEIWEQTGRPRSATRAPQAGHPNYEAHWFGLTRPRASLYRRIDQRVDQQIASGLVDEVRRLLEQGWNPRVTSGQGLGYKEIADYLEGKVTLEEAVARLKRATRQYAKRQLCWWRGDHRIRWLDMDRWDEEEACRFIVEAFRSEVSPGVEEARTRPAVFLSTPDVGT